MNNNHIKNKSNVIKGRVQSKRDTTENWTNSKNFIPLKGEIIIYSDGYGENKPGIKIGDGKTVVQQLQFIGVDAQYNIDGIDCGTSTEIL